MKNLRRAMAVLIASCFVMGCSDDASQSRATPQNPQAGLDVLKDMGKPPGPSEAAKGGTAPAPAR